MRQINALEPAVEALSDFDLRWRTSEFRQRLNSAGSESSTEALADLLPEAFAVVREAGRRVIGQRHFDVQLMGGAALHFGWIAEMNTGEGKTLVATLPAYLNALTGRGVHVTTVNDYLSTRDADWVGPIYRWLGLTVGVVLPTITDPLLKRQAYACDITYGTNSEFGFDYLRDNMSMTKDQIVQRGRVCAVVDDIDSALIDEARTPWIISAEDNKSVDLYHTFANIVRGFQRDVDYDVDIDSGTITPLERGIDSIEQTLKIDNLYGNESAKYLHYLSSALRAKELFRRDEHYVVRNGEIVIVDEVTGRLSPGRRWSEGLHQAIEAREQVEIQPEVITLATITLQNYFRLYEKLSGMTGTAMTEAQEFSDTYGLPVVRIPANRPLVRVDRADLVYKTEEAKLRAVVDDVAERYEAGQPVLLGTVSVEKSERLSAALNRRGVVHSVLNAKHHEKEAMIIAQAGRLHTVTVATNMAGRGVDIILGGNADSPAYSDALPGERRRDSEEGEGRDAERFAQYKSECLREGERVRALGGLYVLGTERHESRRIDNQLRGRAGRQGDPGETRFYLSLEDELMRLFATGAMSWVMGKALPDELPIEAKMVTQAIEKAQATVEERNAEIRRSVLKYDEVMNQQRAVLYRRRQAIVDGADLHDEILESLQNVIDRVILDSCPTNHAEDWDLASLLDDITFYYPNDLTVEELGEATSAEQIRQRLMTDATEFYRHFEERLGTDVMREIERRVMLSIIDQRWREHLSEMDYLLQGIKLRRMGKLDPLSEWQREGYDRFGQMVDAIATDSIHYLMHLDVVIEGT